MAMLTSEIYLKIGLPAKFRPTSVSCRGLTTRATSHDNGPRQIESRLREEEKSRASTSYEHGEDPDECP